MQPEDLKQAKTQQATSAIKDSAMEAFTTLTLIGGACAINALFVGAIYLVLKVFLKMESEALIWKYLAIASCPGGSYWTLAIIRYLSDQRRREQNR